MCNANEKILAAVRNVADLEKMKSEIEEEISRNKDLIIEFMDSQESETMLAGEFVVSYKEVVSTRLDTVALRKLLGNDALAPFNKVVTSKRFQIK